MAKRDTRSDETPLLVDMQSGAPIEHVPETNGDGDLRREPTPVRKPPRKKGSVSPILHAAELIRLAGGVEPAKQLLDEAQSVADILLEEAQIDE